MMDEINKYEDARSPPQDGRDATGKFAPGNPGGGRPRGSRNKATLAVEKLLDGEAESIGRVCIEKALAGDMTAIRLVLERVSPPRKDRHVEFAIPAMNTTADAVQAVGAILQAVADGGLTPAEGQTIAAIIETQRRTIETEEIERRLAELEATREKA
jgi:hypothetical protein